MYPQPPVYCQLQQEPPAVNKLLRSLTVGFSGRALRPIKCVSEERTNPRVILLWLLFRQKFFELLPFFFASGRCAIHSRARTFLRRNRQVSNFPRLILGLSAAGLILAGCSSFPAMTDKDNTAAAAGEALQLTDTSWMMKLPKTPSAMCRR